MSISFHASLGGGVSRKTGKPKVQKSQEERIRKSFAKYAADGTITTGEVQHIIGKVGGKPLNDADAQTLLLYIAGPDKKLNENEWTKGITEYVKTGKVPHAAWVVGKTWAPPPRKLGTVSIRGAHGKYWSAQKNGTIEGNRDKVQDWEKATLSLATFPNHPTPVTIKSFHGKYLSAQKNGDLQWNRDVAQGWETFTLEPQPSGKAAFKSAHGKYISQETSGKVIANRDKAQDWEFFVLTPA